MKRKCICEICTCGRHRCPHMPTKIFEKSWKPCALTEYVEKYLQYDNVQPPQSMKPKQEYHGDRGRMEGITTFNHRISYVPYELEPRFERQKQEYKPNSQPFDDITTHRFNFKGALGEVPKSCKPEHGKVGSDARFESSTEFRDSFQPWQIPPLHVQKSQEYNPPTAHMEVDTTSHLAYVPHQLNYVAPVRPVSHGRRCNVPFQGNSTMKEDFRAWEGRRQEIIKKDHQIPKPTGKFDGLTTFQSHYLPHEIHPTQSFKPSNKATGSSAPFESGTLYRTDYIPKKYEICPANYPSPPGYVFESINARGHKIFQKIPTPEMNLFSNTNERNLAKAIAVIS